MSLEIAGKLFRPDSVAVMPLQQLAPVVGERLTGVLGHDFLEHRVATIDYAARTVSLTPSDGWKPPAGGITVPVWIEADETFVVGTLWAAGRTVPAKLKLDTGSLSGLGLNGSFVAQTHLLPVNWPRRPVDGIAVGGASRGLRPQRVIDRVD